MPAPVAAIDRLIDRLAHADLRHLAWRATDGFLDVETVGSGRIPPLLYRHTPDRPDVGSKKGRLQAIADILAEAAVLGMAEIHVRQDAGIVAWGGGRLHLCPLTAHRGPDDLQDRLWDQEERVGVFRIRALPTAHARAAALAGCGPRGLLPVLDGTPIAHRFISDAAGLPHPEGIVAYDGVRVGPVDVCWRCPLFIHI